MNTDELERQLRGALRTTLDRELGPDPTWAESPAARRVAELGRARRRWPLRVLAVAALIGAGGGAALLAGAPNEPREAANGWIAFTVGQEDPAGGQDLDIWFAALDQEPRRVIGTDTDGVDQLCPAFAPDGRSLAYGSVEGSDRVDPPERADYRNSALVIADVADDGTVSDRLTVDVGDGLPPPCPVWSPDGGRVAFGVPRTSPVNPVGSGEDSEVWVVTLADRGVSIVPDLLATDLDWSPDGNLLAIVGGVETASGEGVRDGLQDGRIHLYDPASGDLRSLDDTLGATSLTWAPDSRRIAYSTIADATGAPEHILDSENTLRVVDIETGEQEVITSAFRAVHGIGPVWSPDGETIAYQRLKGDSAEGHEVVLLRPDDRSEETGLASEVVIAPDDTGRGLLPWRVTWSPDSKYLLYLAWSYPNGCCYEGMVEVTSLVAVPADLDAPSVLLADEPVLDGIEPYDGSRDTTFVPIQTWGNRASEIPFESPSELPSQISSPTPSPSPSTQADPTPSTPASSALPPIDTSSWTPYVSERYGFSIAHPVEWSAHPANGDWTFPEDTDWFDWMLRTDWFYIEPADNLGVAVSAWSVAVEPGTSADEWFLEYCRVSTAPCDGIEERAVTVRLDGYEGSLVPFTSDTHAYFAVGDRIYILAIWQDEDFVTLEPYGGARRLLEAFLSTMRLLPNWEPAAPSSPAPS